MIDINRHTLKNGLRLVHSFDGGTKIVAVNVLYKVGAKNDLPNMSGYAHLLEHLMFGGSKNVPNFDKVLQNVGGENNAYTSADITNYYDILPAQNIETAFWIESDRMAWLNLSEETLSVQRRVVAEEFKQRNLNRPYGDASALYRKLAYKSHPYRIPVIGEKLSHIYNAKLSDIQEYYKRYYAPNNAILSVVGNISFEEFVALAEKWFGDIPPCELQNYEIPKEPQQRKARYKSVERDVPSNMIYKVYHTTSRNEQDYPCFDLITDILAVGKSSRLKRALVLDKKLFSLIDSSITGDIDPGLLMVIGRLNPGVEMQEADNAISEEIARLGSEGVTKRELEKVLNKFESSYLFENIGAGDLAAQMAYYEMLGDANQLNKQIERYRAVTPEQIKRVAQKYLVPENCSTLYYNSIKSKKSGKDKFYSKKRGLGVIIKEKINTFVK